MRRGIAIAFALLLSAVFCACASNGEGARPLAMTILTTDEMSDYLQPVVTAYNESQNDYVFRLVETSGTDRKSYLYSRGVIKGDIVTFRNFNDAAYLSDLLAPVSRLEAAGKIQVSILNSLKAQDGNLYVLPGIGSFSARCFNADLFERYHYAYPETIDEYVTFAQRVVENQYVKGYAPSNGEGMLEEALLSIAAPLFTASTQGVDFLNSYYAGTTTMEDSPYNADWWEVFETYRSLFRIGYYDSSDVFTSDEGMEAFMNAERIELNVTTDLSLEAAMESYEANFSYICYPFVGKTDQKWIVSRPLYYFGVDAESNGDLARRAGIEDFFVFYFSEEGQELAALDARGERRLDGISYVKGTRLFAGENYHDFNEAFLQGRVFLSDTFESVFRLEGVTDVLYEFVNDNLSIAALIPALDAAVSAARQKRNAYYEVYADFDYAEEYVDKTGEQTPNVRMKETAIGNFVADAARRQSGAMFAVLPSDVICCNLFRGSISDRELSVVFYNDELTTLSITGAGIKLLLPDLLAQRGTEYWPIFSGLRIDEAGYVVRSDGKALDDAAYYSVLVSKRMILRVEAVSNEASQFYLNDLILQSIEQSGIILPPKDGRYGGYA